MKNFSMGILILVTVSCGARKKVITQLENDFDNSGNEARLNDLENRVSVLESKVTNNITTINNLSSSLDVQAQTLSDLADELRAADSSQALYIQSLIDQGTAAYNNLVSMINAIQGQTNTALSQLVTLQGQNNVVEYLDPCGDKPNAYDEVILKTSQGDFIVYFEQSGKRFLTKLEKNVQYQTTDSQSCLFKIDTNGTLI